MRKLFLLLLLLTLMLNIGVSDAMVPKSILQRVIFIRHGSSTGTGFTIEVDGRQYLITARHLLPVSGVISTVDIFINGVWKAVKAQSIPVLPETADIGVLVAPQLLTPIWNIHIDKDYFLSQDVYFLGFPYGIVIDGTKANNGAPFPLVKRAIISAFDGDGINQRILLDGINNPGFSGGPVVGVGADRIPEIIGVISGYKAEQQAVRQFGKDTDFSVSTNTGIIVAYPIGIALDAIKQTPIGFPIPMMK